MNLMTVALPDPPQPRTHRWTVDEFYRLVDEGHFEDRRIELIDGEILEMPALRDRHVAAVILAERALRRVFGERRYCIRTQVPLHASDWSEPQPDLAVVPGLPRDYVGKAHPRAALLVVEVSESTLHYDQQRKASLYAAAGIEDYWVVNLVNELLEVRRRPVSDAAQPFGHRYADLLTFGPKDSVAPLARPNKRVKVANLLP